MNTSVVYQTGTGHRADVEQRGTNNTNYSEIHQAGDQNISIVRQRGTDISLNKSVIDVQDGFKNQVYLDQFGTGNTINDSSAEMIGKNSIIDAKQYGNDNSNTSEASAAVNFNTITIYQNGQDNINFSDADTNTGDNNHIKVSQDGTGNMNTAGASAGGNFNNIDIHQGGIGANQMSTAIIMGNNNSTSNNQN
jgi:hypothetical protein